MNNSRGIRNKNPMNVRRSSSRWLGQCNTITDKQFCQFSHFMFGVRAGLYLLIKYHFVYGLNLEDMISRYAPSSDHNDTSSYIHYCKCAVEGEVPYSYNWYFNLVRKICLIESGYKLALLMFDKAFDLLPVKYQKFVKLL